jgi:hypothetical protein
VSPAPPQFVFEAIIFPWTDWIVMAVYLYFSEAVCWLAVLFVMGSIFPNPSLSV